jgi:hypothetical protein
MKKRLLYDALAFARSKIATHPEFNNFPHWSFIVQKNMIVEHGVNMNGPVPVHYGYDKIMKPGFIPKIHAEINAFKKAVGIMDRDSGFECINIRLNKSGTPRMSKPCMCCYEWLNAQGCKSFWFTLDDGMWGKIV